ncbi:signal recognition particle-docking protein FtsY [Leptolyngbya sp. FACHB-261]|uniref:signal recognition particle-docking protein FtsY n=1 Tax=Leptolyngbya sp. FACHB-261 TaxID=2692806 RepID=UPI0016822769|nr:signal recognition particle-docking protein FtsY [Leptolyngbya sp. FACHB-261]MBD2099354.1 signal recognition particle-docking protein FtsY [Leptolyngbya sp. FACHB-261]
MVFNWFERFKQKQNPAESVPAEPEQPAVSPTQEPEAEEKSAEASESAASTVDGPNQDLLSFARAAYKNLQQREQETSSPESASEAELASETKAETAELTPALTPALPSEAPSEPSPEPIKPQTQEEPQVAPLVQNVAEEIAQEISQEVAQAPDAVAPFAEAATVEPPELSPHQIELEPESIPEPVLDVPALEAELGQGQSERAVVQMPEPIQAPELPAPVGPAREPAERVPELVVEATPETAPLDTEASQSTTRPEDGASLPFWARAEADRQARLERLKATAIEETTPEPISGTATESATQSVVSVPELPELPFDEGFLWSAEILAAQGRRAEDISIEEITWLRRLRQGLEKTRRGLVNQLKALANQGPLNADAVDQIETLLLQADAGVAATDRVVKALQTRLRQETLPPEQAIAYLKQLLRDMLETPLQGHYSASFAPTKDTLNIWLMTGVNGAGKTTTIGKIAHLAQKSGYRTLIAAGDTFRAAAVAQVQVWGERAGVDVVANPGKNTDPAAVVFDAITAAQARDSELLLVDTAGRLQNKKNLMDELSKVRRIIDKKAPDAIVESLLVLDATLGQNGLQQAKVFAEAAKLSGVVLTKLDGTARGGVALAVVEQLGLPIRFIGAGEGIEDLRPFSSYEFVEALLSE